MPTSPEELSDSIKEEYLASGCDKHDLDEAVQLLMEKCADLFEDEDAAYAFLHES
jgi:hypothetical protein